MNNELCNFLSNVPNERQRSYELSLTDYVLKNNSAQTINDLTQIADKHPNQQIAYNAFYCLNIIFRRAKDYFKVNNLFEKYTQRFSKHITFEHLKVLFEIESGSMYDYDEMLNVTYKDSELFFDNAGFVHLFADVFATIYENGYIHNMDAFLDGWYQLALNAANKAIELDENYAKYYCTKARILSINHEYDEAMNYINKAISIERSDHYDYTLRICNYQYYKIMIYVNKNIHLLKETYGKLPPAFRDTLLSDIPTTENAVSVTDKPVSASSSSEADVVPQAYNGTAPYAFLSYSHLNSTDAYHIISLLQENGINIWFDAGIEIGSEYAEYIAEKLSKASAFIILITPDSINSEFVRKELQMALDLKMKPICVYLKETMLSPGMMIQLNIYEHIKFYEITEEVFLARILPSLRKKLKIV